MKNKYPHLRQNIHEPVRSVVFEAMLNTILDQISLNIPNGIQQKHITVSLNKEYINPNLTLFCKAYTHSMTPFS